MIKRFAALVIILIAASSIFSTGCERAVTKSQDSQLILVTTTSVQDSGLLDYLLPKFEEKFGCKVKPIAVGSGEAIKMGAKGDADALLVHSPDDEKTFMADKNGTKRKTFMFNYFIIVGPKDDPALLSQTNDIREALNKLADGNGSFISRGDDSGTHKKEKKLWESIDRRPSDKYYITSGQGMGETLQIANEKKAYTLCDVGTFITFEDKLELKAVIKDGKQLLNRYSAITVNSKKFKGINSSLAAKFYNWITSNEVLDMIGKYKEGRVFTPIYEATHRSINQPPNMGDNA